MTPSCLSTIPIASLRKNLPVCPPSWRFFICVTMNGVRAPSSGVSVPRCDDMSVATYPVVSVCERARVRGGGRRSGLSLSGFQQARQEGGAREGNLSRLHGAGSKKHPPRTEREHISGVYARGTTANTREMVVAPTQNAETRQKPCLTWAARVHQHTRACLLLDSRRDLREPPQQKDERSTRRTFVLPSVPRRTKTTLLHHKPIRRRCEIRYIDCMEHVPCDPNPSLSY